MQDGNPAHLAPDALCIKTCSAAECHGGGGAACPYPHDQAVARVDVAAAHGHLAPRELCGRLALGLARNRAVVKHAAVCGWQKRARTMRVPLVVRGQSRQAHLVHQVKRSLNQAGLGLRVCRRASFSRLKSFTTPELATFFARPEELC
jgi:hypothetical protein